MSNIFINIGLPFLFLNFCIQINSKYIVIPLTKYDYDSNNNENILSKIYSNIYYTKLSIGEPEQSIAAFINTSSVSNIGILNKFCDKKFYMNNSDINKDYIYSNSSTFKKYGNENMILGVKDILITDEIKLYSDFDLSNKVSVENLSILYNPNNEGYIVDDVGIDFILEREKKTTCGYIGFQLGFQRNNIYNNLLEQLKEKKIISNTAFCFLEVNKNNELYQKNKVDNLLIIGEELYDIIKIKNIEKYISNKYNRNKIDEKYKLSDYVVNEGYYYFVWKITCSNIYIKFPNENNNTYLEQIDNIYLDNDYGLISGTNEYKVLIEQFFFNDYIQKEKCVKNLSKKNDNNFFYFECDDDINIDAFPSLLFKSKIFQYEYTLDKDDLFVKDNNKLYFLIVFNIRNTNSWKLGKPFLDKYLFSYNYESRIISFYNEHLLEEDKKNSNNDSYNFMQFIIIGFIFLLALISLILGFFIGRIFYNKRKKGNAFELDCENDSAPFKNNYEENKDNKENKSKEEFSINI